MIIKLLRKENFFKSLIGGSIEFSSIILSNIILIPIFLSYWSLETYSCWILLIAAKSLINMVYTSHNNYICFENLKDGLINIKKINSRISSSLSISLILTLILFFISFLEIKTNYVAKSLKVEFYNIENWSFFFSFYILIYGFLINVKNFFIGPISILKKFHIHSLIKGVGSFLIYVTLAIFLITGHDFKVLVIVFFSLEIILTLFYIIYFYPVLKKNKFQLVTPNLNEGLINFNKSNIILINYFLDFFKFDGLRFLISLIAGPTQLIIFTTTRTLVNAANQFIIILEKPLLPLLMNNRKNSSINLIYKYNFYLIIFIINPLAFYSLEYIPLIYNYWTIGKIDFNSLLFLFLCFYLIIILLSLPIDKLIEGNNFLNFTFKINLIFIVILISFIYFYSKQYSLYLIGLGLFVGEFFIFILKLNFAFNKFNLLNKIKFNFIYVILSIFNLVSILILIYVFNLSKTYFSIIFLITNYFLFYLVYRNYNKTISNKN